MKRKLELMIIFHAFLVSIGTQDIVVLIFGVKPVISSIPVFRAELHVSADMFESVNKKTVVHPLFKVGLSLLKRLPEAARLNSDG